jgi:hypothetical protein
VAITFVGAGALAGNATTTSQSIDCHASTLADDILICQLINKSVTANTISAPDGTWTEVITQEVNDCTTAADDHEYALFWKRATAGGTQSFTFTKATDDNVLFAGVISSWRGAVTSGSPLDGTAAARTETAGAADNVSFPAYDPTETSVHVIYMAYYGNDLTTFAAAMSNDTNPDCTTRYDLESSTGNDCSLACTSGDNDGANVAARTWASGSTTDAGSTGVVFALKAATSTTFERSLSDTLAGTDSPLRVADGLRSFSNSAGLNTPQLALTPVMEKELAEQFVALQETVARVADGKRQPTDSLAQSDAFQRVANALRIVTEAAGTADAFQRVADGLRALADTLATADNVQRVANGLRAFANTVGTPDAYQRVANGLRQQADSVGTADATQRLADALRLLTDPLGTTDATQRLANAARALADSLATADSSLRVASAARSLNDAAGLADAFARIADGLRQLSNTVGTADTVQRVADGLRRLTDTLAFVDVVDLDLITVGVITRQLVDGLGMTDAVQRLADGLRQVTDATGATDAYRRQADALRVVTEALGLTDAAARSVDWGRVVSDAAGLSDAAGRVADAFRAVGDAAGLADASLRQVNVLRQFADTLALADAITLTTAGMAVLLLSLTWRRDVTPEMTWDRDVTPDATWNRKTSPEVTWRT